MAQTLADTAVSGKPPVPLLTQDAQKKLMRNFGTGQPLDPVVMLQKGVSLMDAHRGDEAIAVLNKMAAEYPHLPEPHNNLAVIYASRGQSDKARLALEAALRTHPSYAVTMENLSQLYARQAKDAYAKALPASGVKGAAPQATPSLVAMRHVVLPGLSMSPDLLAAVNSMTRPSAAASPTMVAVVPVASAKPNAASISAPASAPASVPASVLASVPSSKPAAPAPSVAALPASASAVVAAKPAPTTHVPVPSTPERQEQQAATLQVRQAVAAWARAWSQQDMDAYFAAYTPAFDGGKGRQAWMDDRRRRITGKKSIEVNVSGISVVMEGGAATAHFKQDYNSGELQVSSNKRLRFAKVGDRWLIDKESVGS